ncbi:MAG: hypothetical protein GEU78_08065 [Actinobacteria bacterium]|nr:hypothetical protein [Actinomycetota bacterium]
MTTKTIDLTAYDMWREPDVESDTALGYYAIWYGPGEEPDWATMIEHVACDEWQVSEWQDVRGLVDDPQARFLVTQIWIDFDTAGNIPRLAVDVGVKSLQEQGGEECWANALPA